MQCRGSHPFPTFSLIQTRLFLISFCFPGIWHAPRYYKNKMLGTRMLFVWLTQTNRLQDFFLLIKLNKKVLFIHSITLKPPIDVDSGRQVIILRKKKTKITNTHNKISLSSSVLFFSKILITCLSSKYLSYGFWSSCSLGRKEATMLSNVDQWGLVYMYHYHRVVLEMHYLSSTNFNQEVNFANKFC